MPKARILLVEDESIVAMDMERRLEGLGYEVTEHVMTGEEAVKRARELQPDLILMDIHLKGNMDGIEAAQCLRSGQSIPIIYITAYSDEDTLARAKITHPFGYILKPFQEREIHSTIEMALYKHRAELELELAKEAAEIGNRAKSDFLAKVSHELRTPLNTILGMTRLALECRDDEERQEFLQLVLSSGDKLKEQIDSILTFSKLESDQSRVDNTYFYLDEVVESSAYGFWPEILQKKLKFYIEIDESSEMLLYGDGEKLRIILQNLIHNAVKFTNKGFISLHVRADYDAESNTVQLRGELQDTGCGIDPEKGEEIFRDFYQLDGSSTRQYNGAGLGLAIVRRLVDILRGRVEYSSTPNEGSTFRFQLSFRRPVEKSPRDWEENISNISRSICYISTDSRWREIRRRQIEQRGLEFYGVPTNEERKTVEDYDSVKEKVVFLVEDAADVCLPIAERLVAMGVEREKILILCHGPWDEGQHGSMLAKVYGPISREKLWKALSKLNDQVLKRGILSIASAPIDLSFCSWTLEDLWEIASVSYEQEIGLTLQRLVEDFNRVLSRSDFEYLIAKAQGIREQAENHGNTKIGKSLLKLIMAARKNDAGQVQEIFSDLKKYV
ncbi:MAG TPA: hybrid sensor histidine kinase/response regulator [Sediminispirochaeta sp.]|nr:hybrid sensor histidine kinase/response regulator [Sediminispirochaeta sp.]